MTEEMPGQLIVCVVLLSAGTVAYGAVTFCQTPKYVHVGQPGTINCTFPEDVGSKKFFVARNWHNVTEDPERIVNCYNIKGQHRCDVLSGYNITSTNGPLQTVIISNVTKQYEGTYRCMIPGDTEECKSCYLNVTEAAGVNGDNGDEEIDTGQDPNYADRNSDLSPGAIAGIVVALIGTFALIVVAVTVMVQKRKHREKKGWKTCLPTTVAVCVTGCGKEVHEPCTSHKIGNDDTSAEKMALPTNAEEGVNISDVGPDYNLHEHDRTTSTQSTLPLVNTKV